MEPGYTAPRMNPEQAPSLPPVSPEFSPQAHPERSAEYESPQTERDPTPQQPQGMTPAAAISAPVVPQPATSESGATESLLSSTPSVAADEDLIEKEWVTKAKRIIAETADDPYRREAAVSQLQREYIRKRYGKELGTSD